MTIISQSGFTFDNESNFSGVLSDHTEIYKYSQKELYSPNLILVNYIHVPFVEQATCCQSWVARKDRETSDR